MQLAAKLRKYQNSHHLWIYRAVQQTCADVTEDGRASLVPHSNGIPSDDRADFVQISHDPNA
jgi:hypothetical protein